MTQRLPVTIEKWSLWLFPATATLFIPIAILGVFVWVPTDAGLGLSQRIFYFHVPCAMASFASYAAAGLCGIAYLRSSASEWDHASNAAVGTGMLYGTLVLITGSIWARTAWGTWWTWDDRLTTFLILWLDVLEQINLILDLEGGFARTPGKAAEVIQVELAQLSYMLPRLRGKGLLLSRLGGGIGTWGPGETKLEMDRRKIKERMARLKKDLEQVIKVRSIQGRTPDR